MQRKRAVRALIIASLLSVVFYLGATVYFGWHDVHLALGRITPLGVMAVLGLALCNYLLRAWRWRLYLALFSIQIPFIAHCRIYLAGFAFTMTPGKAGEMVRSLFLRRYSMRYSASVASFVAERSSDLFAALFLAGAGAWFYPQTHVFTLLIALLVMALFILLYHNGWILYLKKEAISRGKHRFIKLLNAGLDVVEGFRTCNTPKLFVASFVLAVLAWSTEGYGLYLLCDWIAPDVAPSVMQAIFIYALATLVGAFTFLPGGIGGTEAVMVAALVFQGMAEAEAVACTLLLRSLTLWFAVGLGLIAITVEQNIQGSQIDLSEQEPAELAPKHTR
ncbi:MAG: flippase-like domain-containing protein [Magnetococcales bacterium]|nr:flippase-like domain-containing protein [Magnetococcales bacterium]